MMKRSVLVLVASVVAVLACGCGGGPPQLMPTPNVYVNPTTSPFAQTPPAFRNNHAAVMYVTDRAMEEGATPGAPTYGRKRSRSVACGVCDVRFGDESVTWDQLVQASTSRQRSIKLPVEVVSTTEVCRFPPTPRVLIERTIDAPTTHPTTTEADRDAATAACLNELKARLAVSPSKEVFIYVHGVQNSFDDSVRTAAQLWHFLGRQGVVIAYTWPAGGKGLLRGYNYDYNSSEFTVYHLKEMLRVIASCPEVSKVNIIAHSRGTDSTVSALRELHLEISGSGRSTRDVLKLGSVVLAAPDLDVDVVFQRLATARLGQVPERSVIYVCRNDEALEPVAVPVLVAAAGEPAAGGVHEGRAGGAAGVEEGGDHRGAGLQAGAVRAQLLLREPGGELGPDPVDALRLRPGGGERAAAVDRQGLVLVHHRQVPRARGGAFAGRAGAERDGGAGVGGAVTQGACASGR